MPLSRFRTNYALLCAHSGARPRQRSAGRGWRGRSVRSGRRSPQARPRMSGSSPRWVNPRCWAGASVAVLLFGWVVFTGAPADSKVLKPLPGFTLDSVSGPLPAAPPIPPITPPELSADSPALPASVPAAPQLSEISSLSNPASLANPPTPPLSGGAQDTLRVRPIALPPVAAAGPTESPMVRQASNVRVIEVRDGDSMARVFRRVGIDDPALVHQLAYASRHARQFRNISPGKQFHFHFDEHDALERVVYQVSALESYRAVRHAGGFATSHLRQQPAIHTNLKSGSIQNNFYLDGLRAGLSDKLIMELTEIFGWDIDFALEIRKGDRFTVLYEEQYLEGEWLGSGNILAAAFVNRGRIIRAVRYVDRAGRAAYYTPDGTSMRKAFLRTPLDVFRISSHFNLRRKHPILNRIRAHKGTDYAAPTGTPVKAAGDGKVLFAGHNGGYGKMIKLAHGQMYETRYAHLSRYARGIRKGSSVRQGQVIGYVGSTGLSTGPHLHYEFYVNGQVRNPVTVKLPNGKPIARAELQRFHELTKPVLAVLGNHALHPNYVNRAAKKPTSASDS